MQVFFQGREFCITLKYKIVARLFPQQLQNSNAKF